MENQDPAYHSISCECGKTLRLKIREEKRGKEVTATCMKCGREHRTTMPLLETPTRNTEMSLEEIMPYVELFGQKMKAVIDAGVEREDIKALRNKIIGMGFSLEMIVQLGILKHVSDISKEEPSVTQSDADFLKEIKVRID